MLVVSSDNFPPVRVDVCVLFGEELSGRGHRIDWILQSDKQCDRAYVADWGGGKVWVGKTDLGDGILRRIRKHALGILHDMKLFGVVKRGDYQIIQVKDKFLSGIYAVIAARLYGRQFVYWLSYPFPEDYLYRSKDPATRHRVLYRIRGLAFAFLLYRVLLPRARHVFVQSEQMRRDLSEAGVDFMKMSAVPMGIKVQKLADFQGPRAKIPENEKCFMYLGAMTRLRRIDFVIRVLAIVRRTMPEVRLYLVGSGNGPEDELFLREEARKSGVQDAVTFVGQLPQSEALKYVQEADVCVSPFYPTPVLNSTSPTKLIEYMAMGKAVVANDHPEQRLVIAESGGGLCVEYAEEPFAAAVEKLLRDPQLAREMGERGRRYVIERRSYATIANGVERDLLRVAAAE